MEHWVACLHADVSGYCRLIADDVRGTVRTLTAHRAVMSRVVAGHRGRIVDAAGDSMLAAFVSVADAVRCAVDLQRVLKAHNAALPPARRVEFRLGIDVGDVVVEGGRIYGDCVNIAARVQEVAAPGSVCLAGAAYDRLGTEWPVRLEYLGTQHVKNIEEPQRIFRLD